MFNFGLNFFNSVDATQEPEENGPRIGRLVNHGPNPGRLADPVDCKQPYYANSKMKPITEPNSRRPHLCLFAIRDIKQGEELLYDYGVDNLPWMNQVHVCTMYKNLAKNIVVLPNPFCYFFVTFTV